MRPRLIALLACFTASTAITFVPTPSIAAAPAQPSTRPFSEGAPPERGGGGGGANPGMILQRAREIVGELQLSDEQKTKVDAVFKKSRADFDELRANMASLDPRERGERLRDLMQTLRQNVADVLTPQQREVMDQKFDEARQQFRNRFGGGNAGPGERPTTRPAGAGPTSRPGEAFAQRLRDNLAKINLSDEQKAKVKSLFDDARSKGEQLRAEIENGGEEARDKMRELFEQTRQKLSTILT